MFGDQELLDVRKVINTKGDQTNSELLIISEIKLSPVCQHAELELCLILF